MTTPQSPFYASHANLDIIGALLAHSLTRPMSTENITSWGEHIDMSIAPKAPEHSWMFGTPYWDQLSSEQQREVLWLETARDASIFIHLKQNLPPIFMAYLMAFGAVMAPDVEEFLAVVAKEKLVHLSMLRRYLEMAALPVFPPLHNESFVNLPNTLKYGLKNTPPMIVLIWALVLEWATDLSAMAYASSSNEAVTRRTFDAHHADAVRHVAFGKALVEDFFHTRDARELDHVRAVLKPAIREVFKELTFSEEICDQCSFRFPIERGDADAIAQVRTSANNARLNQARFKDINAWLAKLGLIDNTITLNTEPCAAALRQI